MSLDNNALQIQEASGTTLEFDAQLALENGEASVKANLDDQWPQRLVE